MFKNIGVILMLTLLSACANKQEPISQNDQTFKIYCEDTAKCNAQITQACPNGGYEITKKYTKTAFRDAHIFVRCIQPTISKP